MSTGQILLTLGAVSLLLYTAVNINRTYLTSVRETVQVQRDIEVINYGQSLSELMYSQSTNYDTFPAQYGNLTDVSDPATRLEYVTETDDTLYATIEISSEQPLMLDENGRIATITIYDETDGEYIQKGQFFAAITPM